MAEFPDYIPAKAKPPWLDKLQFILFMAFNPCDEELTLYVEMAKAPFGRLALFIIEPDLKEIVENLFTPKGLRSKRHGRKGRKGGNKGKNLLPDVDDLIGSGIPGAQEFQGRRYGGAQRFFFSGVQAIDRVTWPLVLIDEVTDTAFETMSGVMLGSKEGCPNVGRMLRRRGPGNVLELLGWHSPSVTDLRYIKRYTSSHEAVCFVTEGTHSVTFAVSWENQLAVPRQVEMRISHQDGGWKEIAHIGPVTIDPGGSMDLMCSGRVNGGGNVSYEYRVIGGSIWTTKADVFILQIDGGLL